MVLEKIELRRFGGLGLDPLEQEIVVRAYAYVQAQEMAGMVARRHGKIRRKKGSQFSPIHPLRKLALESIGLGEDKIELFEERAQASKELLEKAVREHPVWTDWAYKVKGLGPVLTGLVMAAIGDISRVDNCSGLWKSFGLDVTKEGRARKREPGKKGRVGFPFARLVLGRLRIQIMRTGARAGGFYYHLYESYRNFYTLNRPDWPEGRRFGAALRAMEKILLAHFWEVWRKTKGLPAPESYIIAKNPIHKKIPPEEAMEKL